MLQKIQHTIAEHAPIDSYEQEEKNRGRLEKRYHEVYNQVQGIDPEWKGVQSFIYVQRSGWRPKGGAFQEDHYYISSYPFDCAEEVAKGIRGHWGIENKIHYVKDTHFKEDKNGIQHPNAATILSLFQDITINIYRCLGMNSVKKATIFYANKINELWRFLNANHINDF